MLFSSCIPHCGDLSPLLLRILWTPKQNIVQVYQIYDNKFLFIHVMQLWKIFSQMGRAHFQLEKWESHIGWLMMVEFVTYVIMEWSWMNACGLREAYKKEVDEFFHLMKKY